MDKNFRDMCAIMAMQALVARGQSGPKAVIAFAVADEMVAEREKRDRDEKRDSFGRVVG